MSNFKLLKHLPIYTNLEFMMYNVLEEKKIEWHPGYSQISLNTIKGHELDFYKGTGSLVFDWKNSKIVKDNNGLNKIELKRYNTQLTESDFTILCDQFVGTVFEEIYNELNKFYVLGRVRLMKSQPKSCLSWHVDTSLRIHYPIKTQEGCYMVIGDEVKHLEKNNWWQTNTIVKHTAFNASAEERVHLVAAILDTK